MSYAVNIDNFDRSYWQEKAKEFADYNIYQAWPRQQNRSEISNYKISRAVVTDENNQVCLMCQVRIKRIKAIGLKIGHIHWGPLVMGTGNEIKCCVSALVQLRKAYMENMVNVLRVVPNMPNDEPGEIFSRMLKAAGFASCGMFLAFGRLSDFKLPMSGKEISHVGVFDACSSTPVKAMWTLSDKVISVVKS